MTLDAAGCRALASAGLLGSLLMQHAVDDGGGDTHASGDLADRFALGAAGQDRAAPIVGDHARPAPDRAAFPGRLETVLRFAGDVPAPVLRQREGQVEDEVAFGVLTSG